MKKNYYCAARGAQNEKPLVRRGSGNVSEREKERQGKQYNVRQTIGRPRVYISEEKTLTIALRGTRYNNGNELA